MIIKNKRGFLSEAERAEYFAMMGDCALSVYKYYGTAKVYNGAELLLYHYDVDGHVIWDTVLMCTNLLVTEEEGIRVTLVDRGSYGIFVTRDIPEKVFPYEIMVHSPHRCQIERTVKVTQRGTKLTGVTTAVSFRSKSNPRDKRPHHTQLIPLNKAKNFFGQQEYELAIARAEARNNV